MDHEKEGISTQCCMLRSTLSLLVAQEVDVGEQEVVVW